jgi:asparagine synthase (glutamine-hydrolysing)
MCGIAGVFHDDPDRPVDRRIVEAMCDRIVHRGPDAAGLHTDGALGLGHRRLSIIDVAGGDQPIFNEDGSVCVVFNGEIYNHKPLQRWLEGRGHTFKTRSDTEVIVHAYEEEGPRCIERLRGMFAIALWDARRRRLVLARDRLGKKPLYYSHEGGTFRFASELKSLLADPEQDTMLDMEAISDYLSFLCILAPKTVFRSVRKVMPGHIMVVEDGAHETWSYWDLDANHPDHRPRDQVAGSLLTMLDESVACRLESEVPLGAFLSGGVDSSAVVAMMARHMNEPVRTASIGFDVARYDESDYARRVAVRYRTNHHTQTVKVDAASEEELERLVWHLDEPFADPSAIPTARVSGIARKVVTVALSGDGGDEVLAGYRRHVIDLTASRVRRAVPGVVRENVLGPLGAAWPRHTGLPRPLRLGNALEELARDPARAHFRSLSYFHEEEKPGLFTADARAQLGGYESFGCVERWYRDVPHADPLNAMLYVDIKTYLPDRMLMKVDKTSMLHSLEVRSPFLDHLLVEQCMRIPAGLKVRGGQGKWLLKKIMEPYLPTDVLYRPKQGFEIPLAEWLRGPLAEPLSGALDSLGNRGYLEKRPLRELFDAHQSGRFDHADRLWILYMLELWHRVYRV